METVGLKIHRQNRPSWPTLLAKQSPTFRLKSPRINLEIRIVSASKRVIPMNSVNYFPQDLSTFMPSTLIDLVHSAIGKRIGDQNLPEDPCL